MISKEGYQKLLDGHNYNGTSQHFTSPTLETIQQKNIRDKYQTQQKLNKNSNVLEINGQGQNQIQEIRMQGTACRENGMKIAT